MLKQLNSIPRNVILWGLVGLLTVTGIIVLILSFRSADDGQEQVDAIYTNAAATVFAQQQTQQALSPTVTPVLFTQTATLTATLPVTPTLFLQTPLATNTLAPVSGATGCDNSVWISDVTFPDNTVVTPGQAMTKTWRVQNTGTCTWSTSYKIIYAFGNAMGGQATALPASVAPGGTVDISVAMVAPTTAGDATGTWRLANATGSPFGTQLTIVIKVGGATGTPTKTVTPGSVTSTNTVAPASTSTFTPTVAPPTNTPTETPTPTATP